VAARLWLGGTLVAVVADAGALMLVTLRCIGACVCRAGCACVSRLADWDLLLSPSYWPSGTHGGGTLGPR
jgi:hypothetical protein